MLLVLYTKYYCILFMTAFLHYKKGNPVRDLKSGGSFQSSVSVVITYIYHNLCMLLQEWFASLQFCFCLSLGRCKSVSPLYHHTNPSNIILLRSSSSQEAADQGTSN